MMWHKTLTTSSSTAHSHFSTVILPTYQFVPFSAAVQLNTNRLNLAHLVHISKAWWANCLISSLCTLLPGNSPSLLASSSSLNFFIIIYPPLIIIPFLILFLSLTSPLLLHIIWSILMLLVDDVVGAGVLEFYIQYPIVAVSSGLDLRFVME